VDVQLGEVPSTNDLIRCAVQLIGRLAIPEQQVRGVVGAGKRRVSAYNLCDGQTALSEIARRAKIDQGNFSRAAKRWVQQGVVFWVGPGKDARLMHLYPISSSQGGGRKKK
jgi:hypothetical protein